MTITSRRSACDSGSGPWGALVTGRAGLAGPSTIPAPPTARGRTNPVTKAIRHSIELRVREQFSDRLAAPLHHRDGTAFRRGVLYLRVNAEGSADRREEIRHRYGAICDFF